MKKALICIIAIGLTLVLAISFSACNKENDGSSSSRRLQSNSSSNTTSIILEGNTIEIIGNTVVHSFFYYYGDSTEIVFTYENGRLDNAVYTRQCRDEKNAQTIYDTFTNLNEYASHDMYKNIKLDGLTFTCEYTDFAMQDYKNLSQEELKIYLENESLLP